MNRGTALTAAATRLKSSSSLLLLNPSSSPTAFVARKSSAFVRSPLCAVSAVQQQSEKKSQHASISISYSAFSTASSSAASSIESKSAQSGGGDHDHRREQILSAALEHVHQYGWTEDAIAQAVLSCKLPPSYIANHTTSSNHGNDNINNNNNALELISFFMKLCNDNLKHDLHRRQKGQHQQQASNINRTQSSCEMEVLTYAIRTRLEMNVLYLTSNRWHEGMALGAMYPTHALQTATLLEELTYIIHNAVSNSGVKSSSSNGGHAEAEGDKIKQAAIGGIYIATELFMLTDTSLNYHDTWSFLQDRVRDYHILSTTTYSTTNDRTNPMSNANSDMAVTAGMAVASSIGSAMLSLMTPVAKATVSSIAGVIVPQVASFPQPPTSSSSPLRNSSSMANSNKGIAPRDYQKLQKNESIDKEKLDLISSLPPFEAVTK